MSAAWRIGCTNSPAETKSLCYSDFSLELVHPGQLAIGRHRGEEPTELGVLLTSLCRNRMQPSGSSPAAINSAVVSRRARDSSSGS